MANYQSTFEPLDFNGKPMGLPLDSNDLVDSMNLSSSCQLSDLVWPDKDPFDMFSWNLAGVDQPFDPLSDSLDLEQNSSSYISSPHELSAGYADYMIKTEDGLSNASPLSDPGSDLWSPSLRQDIKSSSSSPLDSIGVRHKQEEEEDDNVRSLKKIPRKHSNASTASSSRYSATSPLASPKSTINSKTASHTNTKSSRAVLSHENDVVAVMKRKKAAHNAIEKRYRTNMNAKFLALGNAIPRAGSFPRTSLASHKGTTKKSSSSQTARGSASGSTNGQQEQQPQQQNKSEILTNALSYIHELQDENARLKTELLVLKENLLPRGSMMWRR